MKKRIVRTLIHEIVVPISTPRLLRLAIVVHWSGRRSQRDPLAQAPRRGQRNSTPADVIAAVRELALIASDDLIAGLLNRNGLKTGHGNRWTRERVTSLRLHPIASPVFKTADDGVEPWLNLSDAARLLRIASKKTPRPAAEAGKIEARHPFRGRPLDLSLEPRFEGDAAKALVERAHRKARYPTGSDLAQQSLLQWHRQMGVLDAGL